MKAQVKLWLALYKLKKAALSFGLVGLGFVLALAFGGSWVPLVGARPDFKRVKKGDPIASDQFIRLARKANPAVVSITLTDSSGAPGVRPGNPFFSPHPGPQTHPFFHLDPFQELFKHLRPMSAPPAAGDVRPAQSAPPGRVLGNGSGFVIGSDGHIITNNHVIMGRGSSILVQFMGDTKTYKADVVGQDARTDIALIKVNVDRKLPTVVLGKSSNLEVGEWVAAIGNPLGQSNTVTVGVVSYIGRKIEQLNSIPFIQTDASINPGNSGGPLLNLNGEAVGVNTAINAAAQGIGYAIPIDEVREILPALKRYGKIIRAWLGVGGQDLNLQAAQYFGFKDGRGSVVRGAFITQVQADSPAARAGVSTYDLIVELGGKAVKSFMDLRNVVQDSPVDKKLSLKVLRPHSQGAAPKELELSVVLVKDPRDEKVDRLYRKGTGEKGQPAPHNFGFLMSALNSRLKSKFNLPDTVPNVGVVVVQVYANSPAARAGLQSGDVILQVNKKKTLSPKNVARGLKKGQVNVLLIQRQHRRYPVFLES